MYIFLLMRYIARTLVLAFVLLAPFAAVAQTKIFLPDTSIKVFAFGQEQVLAWCGGFNNAQFTMGDLNHDGLQDLVVFESYNSLRTFINMGTAGHPNYRYAPEYALNFPPLYDYCVLADYDRDGIPDLFHQGGYGFEVFKGYYNAANQLCFNFYEDLWYFNDASTGSGPGNAFNNPGDIPAIVDVDNDGDLDFISYNITGGTMNYYRNMQVEYGMPNDSIHIDLWDECWGKVFQGYNRTHTLAQTCDNSSLTRNPGTGGMERTTHQGNTPCLFDWDMDGDYDYLDGSISFNEMTFLKNGRMEFNPTGADSMYYQDTMWQNGGVGGTQIELPIWPAAFNVDIDQDGKKDILVSPNIGLTCMNYDNVWYYKNESTPGAPNWVFQSKSYLGDQSIDLGTGAYPILFDYNKDGKLDLFIGSDGYRQTTGGLQSKMSYYQNTGTTSSPAFTLQTDNLLNMFSLNFAGAAPAIGDIDNDGKSDLIIGHSDGTLTYYKNNAASESVTPNWQLTELVLTDMNGDTINTGGYSAPAIYDLNKDGKPDLIIGNVYGTLEYYRNVSTTPGSIKLKLMSTTLGNVLVDTNEVYGMYSTPFFGKVDTTGVDYLLVGSNSGNIYEFTGFQTGNDSDLEYPMINAHFSYIDSIHNWYNNYYYTSSGTGVYENLRTAPCVGDIIGDGSYEMLVGEKKGGVELYKLKVNTENEPIVTSEQGKVIVYPNPAKETLNISWNDISEPNVQISVINMEGQYLFSSSAPSSLNHTSIPLSSLSTGMYVCILQSGANRYYNKFTVIR
jgi:hypothetical protein